MHSEMCAAAKNVWQLLEFHALSDCQTVPLEFVETGFKEDGWSSLASDWLHRICQLCLHFVISSDRLLRSGDLSAVMMHRFSDRHKLQREPPLTDTSCKRTPPISRYQTTVPAISLLKVYISNLP